MRRLRVLQVNKFCGRHLGGVEAVLDATASVLARRGHMVHILACRRAGAPVSPLAADVTATLIEAPVVSRMPLHPGFAWELRRCAGRSDLVHFHLPFPLAEAASLTLPKRTPWAASFHAEVLGRGRLVSAAQKALTQCFLDRVDSILVGSPPLADSPSLRRHRAKVRIVPYGFDLAPESGAAAVPGPRPVVLFVGRLVRYKGVEVLLRALAGLDAEAHIVGAGPELERLRALAAGLNISPRVRFLGPLSDAQVGACYRAATVLALPSLTAAETFGVVQVEAMAAGLPIVNTRLGTGTDWVSPPGLTGLTVPPGDVAALRGALQSLFDQPRLRRALSQSGPGHARSLFEIARYGDALEDLYAGICRQPSAHALAAAPDRRLRGAALGAAAPPTA